LLSDGIIGYRLRWNKDHRAAGVEAADDHPCLTTILTLRSHPNFIPYLTGLELRDDLKGVVNLSAKKVFKPRVAVITSTVVSKLNNPGPDPLRRGFDRDRMGNDVSRFSNELIARPSPAKFLIGGSPASSPGPEQELIRE
jgi:hypothetical protein